MSNQNINDNGYYFYYRRPSSIFNSDIGNYAYGNFFGDILDVHLGITNRRLEMLENEMIRRVEIESLQEYKTQERKPGVKLNINNTIIDNKNISLFSDKNCSICMEKFEKDNKIIILECDHVLHTDCIKEWVKYKSECPVCRKNIDTTDINENMENENTDNFNNEENTESNENMEDDDENIGNSENTERIIEFIMSLPLGHI